MHKNPLSTAPAAALTSPHHAWQVVEERKLQEFDIDATLLVHKKTKARYLHMACKDDNNAFSVNFRTTPMDSTGVAHILEHTALCGSARFPVRDPFMKVFLNKHNIMYMLKSFLSFLDAEQIAFYIHECDDRPRLHPLPLLHLQSPRLLQSYVCLPRLSLSSPVTRGGLFTRGLEA